MTARVVIDTNVLLDFWVFADTRARALHDALLAGRVQAARSDATDAELIEVLARPAFDCARARRADGFQADLQRWRNRAQYVARIVPCSLLCSDRADQKFLDLAISVAAHALISKDRALLKLARKAKGLNLAVVPPEAALAALGVVGALE